MAQIKSEANARLMRVFMAQLKGKLNTFQMPATEGVQHALGNVATSGSTAQGATTMTLATAGHGLTLGMLMSVPLPSGSKQLAIVTGIASAVINFEPPLRETVAGGVTVETTSPYALVSLTDSAFNWSVEPGQFYNFSFSVEEAF